MGKKPGAESQPLQDLREFALGYPEAEEGIACEGTSLECATVTVRKKTFLFLSGKEVRVKLGESLAEAATLAEHEPGRYKVGATGWVTIALNAEQPLPIRIVSRWIDESYRLLAPKKLVAMLAERTPITKKGKKQ